MIIIAIIAVNQSKLALKNNNFCSSTLSKCSLSYTVHQITKLALKKQELIFHKKADANKVEAIKIFGKHLAALFLTPSSHHKLILYDYSKQEEDNVMFSSDDI